MLLSAPDKPRQQGEMVRSAHGHFRRHHSPRLQTRRHQRAGKNVIVAGGGIDHLPGEAVFERDLAQMTDGLETLRDGRIRLL